MARLLFDLRDYMRCAHAVALSDMVLYARTSWVERLFATKRARLELIVLEKACKDPDHVWADAEVVRLVHDIRQNGTGIPDGGPSLL